MDTVLHQEEQNRKIGLTVSIVLHAALILLALLNLFTFPTPPPGQPSVAISFGAPDVGQGEEEPAPAQLADATEAEPAEVEEPEDVVEEREVVEKPKDKPKKDPPKKAEPKKDDTKKITDDSNARKLAKEKADKKKRVDAAKAKAKAEANAEAAAERAAEKAKADAAAKKAAAAAAAKKAKEDAKNKIGDLFKNNGQGSGDGGQGTTDTPGNAGVEDGDPNSDILEGESSGNGSVDGFGGRGYNPAGPVTGNFQEVGTVRLRVCVDSNGKVISAKQKLSGSTTQSSKLVALAIKNAKKYNFDKSDEDQQCGNITYRFKLQ